MPSGEAHSYTQGVADQICRYLAEGMSLREACRQKGMPSESTVRTWVLDNREGFSAHYARAREIGYHTMADELLEISDDGSNDWMKRNKGGEKGYEINGEHVARSRIRVDTRKWLLAKALPKIYGDKLVAEHSGPNGGPIPTLDVTRLSTDALRELENARIESESDESTNR